jgi:zinc transporter
MAAGSGSISTSPICVPANTGHTPGFPAARALVAADEHQQLQRGEARFYGVLADLVCGLSGATEEIGFAFCPEKIFISSRRHQLNAIEATRKALRLGAKVPTPAALLELIAGQMIESLDHFADGLADQLDLAEERILADELNVDRKVVGSVRRTTVRVHRQLVTLRALIQRFEHEIEESENPALNLRTKKLLQRLDWLDTEIVELRDRSRLLQEEIMLKSGEQTNRSLHVLAIVTTVFLPATLVTGVFGMNVAGLPLTQNGDGFLWAMVLTVSAAAFVYWLLRRSGTLGR